MRWSSSTFPFPVSIFAFGVYMLLLFQGTIIRFFFFCVCLFFFGIVLHSASFRVSARLSTRSLSWASFSGLKDSMWLVTLHLYSLISHLSYLGLHGIGVTGSFSFCLSMFMLRLAAIGTWSDTFPWFMLSTCTPDVRFTALVLVRI